ncbi:reversion-inducing cysteine-rich protein with Kazal motifs-like [Watersipora subatra]|uniref:reversion-inducing cysteine-rich protein with Kazal motifs-like n=1 Tax=Watersipora subatra TaxID=2589382 RepID=UPI00355B7595
MDYPSTKLWTICLLLSLATGSQRDCCRHIPNRSRYAPCKDACEQAWMSSGPLQQVEIFSSIYRHCSLSGVGGFWSCINSNYPVLNDIELWEGRPCCELAYSTGCQMACRSAMKGSDIQESCVLQEETALYSCIRRQTGTVACCGGVYSDQCRAACRAMFVSESLPSQTLQENMKATCTSPDAYALSCVSNRTQHQLETTLPATSLSCCDESSTSICKQTCVQAFNSLSSQNDIIEMLIPVCGLPSSTEPLWQCFLLSQAPSSRGRSQESKQLSPTDGASLQCCARASSAECRVLCIELFDSRLSSVWESFDSTCRYDSQETAMMECIQDVEEPCQMGCNQLQFCSNFNDRDFNMFRNCDKEGDLAASIAYNSWQRDGAIELPSDLKVPIKSMESCEPDLWKAIACALNVKPCKPSGSNNGICKSDCVYILQKCVDNSFMSYDIPALCDQLAVSEDTEQCISLIPFTSPTDEQTSIDFSNPCVPNPCNSTEVCEVNRKFPSCTTAHKSCHAYICRSGCSAGDASPLLIKANYHVKMPDTETERALDCYKICKCSHNGFLAHCQETYCEQKDVCIIDSTRIVEHGTRFKDGCRDCVCHTGQTICSMMSCSSPSQVSSAGLPCGCLHSYQPVCTDNGQVFHSPCLAECAGYSTSSYTTGNCASMNPCGIHRCLHGSKCVPERKVCLSATSPCPQHKCVPAHCDSSEHDVVCDDLGLEHPNVCILLARKRQLSYMGHCMTNCVHSSPICGINGETYMSECAALADSVLVDYHSSCHSAPAVDGSCSSVTCERNIPEWCQKFTPRGACCPVCGSEIRILYSTINVDVIMAHSDIQYITVKDIAEHLRHYLTNRICSLFAYLSFEKEMVVIILPTNKYPTSKEVEFCIADAQRISNLIESQSPILTTDVTLSILLTSSMHSSQIISDQLSASEKYTLRLELLLLLYLIVSLAVT